MRSRCYWSILVRIKLLNISSYIFVAYLAVCRPPRSIFLPSFLPLPCRRLPEKLANGAAGFSEKSGSPPKTAAPEGREKGIDRERVQQESRVIRLFSASGDLMLGQNPASICKLVLEGLDNTI